MQEIKSHQQNNTTVTKLKRTCERKKILYTFVCPKTVHFNQREKQKQKSLLEKRKPNPSQHMPNIKGRLWTVFN
jgi:hypothetical protein